MTTAETSEHDLVSLAADIVSAYVANNCVRPADLPDLIASTHVALGEARRAGAPVQAEKPTRPSRSARPSPRTTSSAWRMAVSTSR